MTVQLNYDRIQRFNAYRETLTEEEKQDLDDMIATVCDNMKTQTVQFGRLMAIELIMALVESNVQLTIA